MQLYETTVARVQEIIGDMSPAKPAVTGPDLILIDDLGYDSIHFLELALALEQEFNLFEFDEEQAVGMITVGDVAHLIAKIVVAAEDEGGDES